MEEMDEFKYTGAVLSNHGENEGEISKKAVKGRSIIGALASVIKGRNVSMKVKRGLGNSINVWIRDVDVQEMEASMRDLARVCVEMENIEWWNG